MKIKKYAALVCAVGLLAVTGCTQRIGDFTAISTKNVNIGEKYVRVAVDVEGVDSKPIIVVIPMGVPNLETAVDNALRAADAELLTDAVIYLEQFYIPYIYGETKYVVKGTAWKRASRNLRSSVDADLQNAPAVYTLTQGENGQYEFVEIAADDSLINDVK